VDFVGAVPAAVLTSSVVAAGVAAGLSDRNERRKQLRDKRLALAGDFASDAMAALATLRDFKPTPEPGHRNERLHTDRSLREKRQEAAKVAVDRLRPMWGPIRILFPTTRGDPKNVAGWAQEVVEALRDVEEVCSDFWAACESPVASELRSGLAKKYGSGLEQESREELGKRFNPHYKKPKERAWRAVGQFTEAAVKWLEPHSLFERIRRLGGHRILRSLR
jgi:hypothetical protein